MRADRNTNRLSDRITLHPYWDNLIILPTKSHRQCPECILKLMKHEIIVVFDRFWNAGIGSDF